MIRIVPYEPDHGRKIRIQAAQLNEPMNDPAIYVAVGESFTGMLNDEILFCAGRAYGRGVWVMLSVEAKHHMVAVTRALARLLRKAGACELEALVMADFKEAHRWAKMFGFVREGHDPDYNADIYVRRA